MEKVVAIQARDIDRKLDEAAETALPNLVTQINSYLENNWDNVSLMVNIAPMITEVDPRVIKRLSTLVVKTYQQMGWTVNAARETCTDISFAPKG